MDLSSNRVTQTDACYTIFRHPHSDLFNKLYTRSPTLMTRQNFRGNGMIRVKSSHAKSTCCPFPSHEDNRTSFASIDPQRLRGCLDRRPYRHPNRIRGLRVVERALSRRSPGHTPRVQQDGDSPWTDPRLDRQGFIRGPGLWHHPTQTRRVDVRPRIMRSIITNE